MNQRKPIEINILKSEIVGLIKTQISERNDQFKEETGLAGIDISRAFLTLALKSLDRFKNQTAADLLAEVLRLDNVNELAFISMALAEINLNNYGSALSYYNQAATLHNLLGGGSQAAQFQHILKLLNEIQLIRPAEKWEDQYARSNPQIELLNSDGIFSSQFLQSLNCEFIIHRGCFREKMENSIEGVTELLSISQDITIEIDVSMTKDNVLILNHDATLLRLWGANIPVIGATYEEIQSIYAVETLAELLDTFPNQKFILDIKHDFEIENTAKTKWVESNSVFAPDKILAPFRDILAGKSPDKLRLTAFSRSFMEAAKQYLPAFDIVLSHDGAQPDISNFLQTNDSSAFHHFPTWLMMEAPVLDANLAQSLKEQNHKMVTAPSGLSLYEQMTQVALLNIDATMISYSTGDISELILKPRQKTHS